MSRLLVSVNCIEEALLAQQYPVGIIDLKQPRLGVLGALPIDEVTNIVNRLNGAQLTSATVGDLDMQPQVVFDAVSLMGATHVNFVKIGFFPNGDWEAVIDRLKALTSRYALIAVLFAELQPDLALIDALADAGFAGVMLDTMNKEAGALPEVLPIPKLFAFVAQAKARGLIVGLAGALRMPHIPLLLPLQADYLGFRGAICEQNQRRSRLSEANLQTVSALLSSA